MSLYELPELLAWNLGYTLRGVTFTQKELGWLMVVRASHPKGGKLVAFLEGTNIQAVTEYFVYLLGHRPGIVWKEDKWAK